MKNVAILALIVCSSFAHLIAKDSNTNIRFKYYVSKIEENKEPFNDLFSCYDSIINLCVQRGDIDGRIKYTMNKAKLAVTNGEYTKAFNTYTAALNIIDTKENMDVNDIENKKSCMYQIGKVALNLGMYDESISYLFDLLEYNKDWDLNYTVSTYSLLGIIFFNIDKVQTAEEYLGKAKNIIKATDTLNDHSLINFYNGYSGLFYFKMEYDTAVKYLSMAEMYSKKLNDNELINKVYHNFAIIYQDIEEYDMAEDYFMRVLDTSSGIGMSYMNALTLQNIAFLYKLRGDNAKSINYYQKALYMSAKMRINKIRSSVLIEISDLFYENGDYRKSRDYLNMGRQLKDSIFNTQNMDRIMILTNRYETRNEKIEKELLEKTLLASELANKNKTIVVSILVVMFAIFIIVIFVSIRKILFQRKANKMLSNTIVELRQKTQCDILNSKQELETIIDDRNRELTSTALCLIKANEMLSTLKEEVRRLSNSRVESERKEIIREISVVLNSYSPEQGWVEFKLYFEKVHQSFFASLNEQHPDLTHGEQRICALLILNMNTKEIASITNRSSRTVESFIYKIRQKLNIPAEIKTACYLRKFLN